MTYELSLNSQWVGEQVITVENFHDTSRLVLEARVDLPAFHGLQRWESEVDASGVPLRYTERIEGGGTRMLRVEFSRKEGLILIAQGQEEIALPYLTETYDPLSLLFAIVPRQLAVGETARFPLFDGRAYAERLPDRKAHWGEQEMSVQAYRLRPGLSLLFYDEEGRPVEIRQRLGDSVIRAGIKKIERFVPEHRTRRRAR